MSDVSRALTVICQRCLHSPSLSYILYPLLFLASIFPAATYYLQISLFLISFYSISVSDNSSCSFLNLCICVSFVFYVCYVALLESPVSVCVRCLFASLPAPLFFLSLSPSLSAMSHTTYVSVSTNHLDLFFFSHHFTFMSFPFLLLSNPAVWTALAVSLPLNIVKNMSTLAPS